jgi:deoxyribodipyrimidine photolyase-related protein
MDIFLIFPIHLYSDIKNLYNKNIYLIEDPRYFTDFKYHKLKLAYHRATMKYYYDYLLSEKINVKYIEFSEVEDAYKELNKSGKNIYTYDLADKVLEKRLKKIIPNIIINKSLNFLVDEELIKKNLKKFYNGKKYNHQNFYKWQRIRLNILVNSDESPVGGRWSFDSENRKKLPSNVVIPKIINVESKINDKYIEEAKKYINKHFSSNYGSLDNFIYPINHNDSKKWLDDFLKHRFEKFGMYEDAETERDPFLFHSVLTPMMNIGLLTDTEVLDTTKKFQNKVCIESFEGFIRQIIGWRNYVYTLYLLEGETMRTSNFLNNTNKLNKEVMWTGTTNILPIDYVINKIVDYSYAHHIERLMYLGNYMLICMIDPKDVYEIFMEWTIDAYDWVMVPNVYGMTQFADGGLMMTRPYFSSSNYILKMSDYKKDSWCVTYDALYYNFINKHEDYLASNYATSRQVAFWRKKSASDKKKILDLAKNYLKIYTK